MQEIVNVSNFLQKRTEALQSLDLKRILPLFAPNAEVVDASSNVTSAEDYLQKYLPLFRRLKINNVKVTDIVVRENKAYTLEKYDFDAEVFNARTKIKGQVAMSCVLQRIDNEWKIVQYCVSNTFNEQLLSILNQIDEKKLRKRKN
ncbi:MAG: nuclear transport factor 2 family protein [Runella slithyformis]|jgi:ketosteroid isomerase-like protein|nr:MAG: nuclear transport factor 2 family protein [Runella slithyformis]TAG43256.1 MAG: nuclear transport factor 2 family protein [Cytophagia bacterium]TAG73478.1 MAG: nuclear transport factor 2 family protein [Runella slithyformis]